MTELEKQEILEASKVYFPTRIAKNHRRNTAKAGSLSAFDVNPFLLRYLSKFAFGNTEPESLAKTLLYPRLLGTSISTSFGTNIQYFCKDVLSTYASTTSGIDIEFIDALGGRRKYCQLKAGPNTINKDDVETIRGHFRSVRNLARTNGLPLQIDDCVVGVIYGTNDALNGFYQALDQEYHVYAGAAFWEHLTGDPSFYADLIGAFEAVADETDGSALLQSTIERLAAEIAQSGTV